MKNSLNTRLSSFNYLIWKFHRIYFHLFIFSLHSIARLTAHEEDYQTSIDDRLNIHSHYQWSNNGFRRTCLHDRETSGKKESSSVFLSARSSGRIERSALLARKQSNWRTESRFPFNSASGHSRSFRYDEELRCNKGLNLARLVTRFYEANVANLTGHYISRKLPLFFLLRWGTTI